jgi:hypothetical protein
MKAWACLAVIVIVFQHSSYGQMTFKCAGKSYIIPYFKSYTIQKYYTENRFEELKILEPIEKSVFPIELRAYYMVVNASIGSAVIIKGDSNKIVAEAYYYRIQWDSTNSIQPKGFKTTWLHNRKVYYTVKSVSPSDTLLTALIRYKLFTQPEIDLVIRSLKQKNINVAETNAMDPYHLKFELKAGNQYRSYICDSFRWYANKDIHELRPEKLLFDVFNQLYIDSGQELNHLFP